MNKKQIICMWCGIAVFVFVGLITAAVAPHWWRSHLWGYYVPLLIVYWPSVAIVTGGLIYTFRDKKKPEDGTKKPMNLKRGFFRLTIVVSLALPLILIIGGIVSYGHLPPADDWIGFLPICVIWYVAVWATYAIIRWLVKGFQENTG